MGHYDTELDRVAEEERKYSGYPPLSRIDIIGTNGGDGLHYMEAAKKKENVVPEVMKDLVDRMAKGAKEYGQPLQTNNGRNALLDAYEEVLDLACYLKQRMMEDGK